MFCSNRLIPSVPVAAITPVHHCHLDSTFGAGDGKPSETKASPSRRRLPTLRNSRTVKE